MSHKLFRRVETPFAPEKANVDQTTYLGAAVKLSDCGNTITTSGEIVILMDERDAQSKNKPERTITKTLIQ